VVSQEKAPQSLQEPRVPPLPQAVAVVPGWQLRFASQQLVVGQLKGQLFPHWSTIPASPQVTPQPCPGVQQE
jgi:hypothetical protein